VLHTPGSMGCAGSVVGGRPHQSGVGAGVAVCGGAGNGAHGLDQHEELEGRGVPQQVADVTEAQLVLGGRRRNRNTHSALMSRIQGRCLALVEGGFGVSERGCGSCLTCPRMAPTNMTDETAERMLPANGYTSDMGTRTKLPHGRQP
jgi:hypothetical protein